MNKNKLTLLLALAIFILTTLGCNFNVGDTTVADESRSNSNGASNKSKNSRENKTEADAETPVRSTELVDAFRKDKAAANDRYKDKVILISGKITNINDVFGVKALNLRDADDAIGLQTYLANGKEVEKVKVGDEVVVRGKVRGDALDVIDHAEIIKVN